VIGPIATGLLEELNDNPELVSRTADVAAPEYSHITIRIDVGDPLVTVAVTVFAPAAMFGT
jgi:hypothetical protein